MNSNQTRHATYNINYHFVWCPKYRRTVLGKKFAQRLAALIHKTTAALRGEDNNLVIQPDYVHLFCRFPPTFAPYQIMHRIKGSSAHVSREESPWLTSRLPHMWTRRHDVGTAGDVAAETMQRSIEAQKGR